METLSETRSRLQWIEPNRLARLVLDEGRGNVLGLAALARLRGFVAELAQERSLRGVVIDHTGEHFSFGAAVDDHLPGKVSEMLTSLHALARELLRLETPILAAVRGRCLGGGLELALLADRIVAAPGSSFGQPEVRLGVFAPIGSLLLPRAVGARRASEMLLSGGSITAETALDWGLVAELATDPGAAAVAWMREQLESKSAVALRHATRAARRTWAPAFEAELMDLERTYLEELTPTHDAQEGLDAFLGKRAPHWEDR